MFYSKKDYKALSCFIGCIAKWCGGALKIWPQEIPLLLVQEGSGTLELWQLIKFFLCRGSDLGGLDSFFNWSAKR